MARRKSLSGDSHLHVVQLAGTVSDQIPLPDGVILRDEDEMVIWRQFTRARATDGWRDFDLLIVAKAVRLETDIRRYQTMLDGQGAIVHNDRGTAVINPLLTVIDSLQRQQSSLFRSISLNQQPKDARTLNGQGQQQAKLRTVINSLDDLIAK